MWSIDDVDDVRRSATVTSRRGGVVAAVRARTPVDDRYRDLGLATGSSDLVAVDVPPVEEDVNVTGGHGTRADHMNHVMTDRAGTVHARSITMTTEARRHTRRELLQTGGM